MMGFSYLFFFGGLMILIFHGNAFLMALIGLESWAFSLLLSLTNPFSFMVMVVFAVVSSVLLMLCFVTAMRTWGKDISLIYRS